MTADQQALPATDRIESDLDRELAAIAAASSRLVIESGAVLKMSVAQPFWDENFDRLADQFIPTIAKQPLGLRIDEQRSYRRRPSSPCRSGTLRPRGGIFPRRNFRPKPRAKCWRWRPFPPVRALSILGQDREKCVNIKQQQIKILISTND